MDNLADPFIPEKWWRCPRCGAAQLPSKIKTIEIIEPGKNPRIEYHGKIRPTKLGNSVEYTCLVCGHVWGPSPEDPTPGGASVTFLHPVLEDEDDELVDKDAC